jgi:hypothetical protein
VSARRAAFTLTAAALLTAAAAPARANGALYMCGTQRPYVWPARGAQIPFHTDQGNLGVLTNAEAVALVQSAFDAWDTVPTSNAGYVHQGSLPVDVDLTNFAPYYDAAAPDGLHAVVFDATGEIFEELFGFDSGILGFAGPEWVRPSTCQVTEGYAFLNGVYFDDLTSAFDVMVHEFGHYSGLAHTVVNGQLLGFADHSGPTPHDTFGPPADVSVIETMYPFYFGPGSGTGTLAADDVAGLSSLYPTAEFARITGSIRGTVYAGDGLTKRNGVNVIARNVANPFADAVSTITGSAAGSEYESDLEAGRFTLNGLTPGATYAVYVDELLAGGFSTTPARLSGVEEFYNGARESNNVTRRDPVDEFVGVDVAAGIPVDGVDIVFNIPREGDPVKFTDDGARKFSLPFPYSFCGVDYDSVWVNSNGTLTFGRGDGQPYGHPWWMVVSNAPPRIAALWTDLVPNRTGAVTWQQSATSFSVSFTDVAEYPNDGSNSFRVTLHRWSTRVDVSYGTITAKGGLAGITCGGQRTSGFEPEVDLSALAASDGLVRVRQATVFEYFEDEDNDLSGLTLRYRVRQAFPERAEPNDSIATARRVAALPFSTLSEFTAIEPRGGDVDYYRVELKAGTTFIAETLGDFLLGGHRTSFDTLLGLFDAAGTLLFTNDNRGDGSSLSLLRYPVFTAGTYYLAVGAHGDQDFDGTEGASGGRYVLSLSTASGTELKLGDDDYFEVPLPFAFPFQGHAYTSVFVNSNGSLTFGAGDYESRPSAALFLDGPPRIAALWADLAPMYGGTIVLTQEPNAWSVEFRNIPEIGTLTIDETNTFKVTLSAAGAIEVRYAQTANSWMPRLAGITPGGGALDPGGIDLSAAAGPLPALGTTYELFAPLETDLAFTTLTFVP